MLNHSSLLEKKELIKEVAQTFKFTNLAIIIPGGSERAYTFLADYIGSIDDDYVTDKRYLLKDLQRTFRDNELDIVLRLSLQLIIIHNPYSIIVPSCVKDLIYNIPIEELTDAKGDFNEYTTPQAIETIGGSAYGSNNSTNNPTEDILKALKEKQVEEFELILTASLENPELKKSKDEEESNKALQAIAKIEEEQVATIYDVEDYSYNDKSNKNDILYNLYTSSHLPNKPESTEDIVVLTILESIISDSEFSIFTGMGLLGLPVMSRYSNIEDIGAENIDMQLGVTA